MATHGFADKARKEKQNEDRVKAALMKLFGAESVTLVPGERGQKAGLDAQIIMKSGGVQSADVKLRFQPFEQYKDILLEFEHRFVDEDDNVVRKEDGWVKAPLLCDWLVTVWSCGQVIGLPFHSVQRAFSRRRKEWIEKYGKSARSNGFVENWQTHFVTVPARELFDEIEKTFVVKIAS